MLLILDVDADKYDSVVDAMKKRPSIRVVSMDREARKNLRDCPACGKRLSKEKSFTIDDRLVESLTKIVEKMQVAKSVVLVNKENPITALTPVEHPRCIEVDPVTIFRAETLGLLKSFVDGSRLTHFVTAAGMDFLAGEKPASPSTMYLLDDVVVETSGELAIENVEYDDAIKASAIPRDAARAVKALPDWVMNFVTKGQMSLI